MENTKASQLQAIIIEDQVELAYIFGVALEEAGFAIHAVHDGTDAIDKINALLPNIVVLDLHLPHVSGGEILEYMKADEQLKHTCIIVISADPHTAALYKNEVDLVLVKPVGYHQIRDLFARFAKHMAMQGPSLS